MSENETVAKAATQEREIPLDRMALIGTFGTEEMPHALVRQSSGRIVRVTPGERLAGRQVLSIGVGEVLLGKGNGVTRLAMPAG
ncbi:hypothetical protein [Tropicimonas sp. IMCC6043]|uniref:hypothetical protein n=1 Tax=Tropicimonas sp. IMCC6043 TaxID=2510645 RepID=UPI00101C64DD|nr:hypothetical protein [Tropicimonas sp. IMCC6043]RYH11249.1 hypothetical protein EU800_05145 [Tropicimonas sp. IMCC6043]